MDDQSNQGGSIDTLRLEQEHLAVALLVVNGNDSVNFVIYRTSSTRRFELESRLDLTYNPLWSTSGLVRQAQ